MKKFPLAVAMVISIIALSLIAHSKLGPSNEIKSTTTYISPKIDLVEKKSCTTTYFEEVVPVYGECTFYRNITSCLNTSGAGTECSVVQSTYGFGCIIGSSTSNKNSTSCTPNKEFIIEFDSGETTLKKKIDYSDWGPCIQEAMGNCLIVTCVSYNDGAHNGEFTDCSGGKSCQRFEICDNYTRTYYKNSREDFAEDDPTFYYKRLGMEEVG